MKEGEIERIITLLSESEDVDACKNIAKDLFRLMINGLILFHLNLFSLYCLYSFYIPF